jgi:hypothetical protein
MEIGDYVYWSDLDDNLCDTPGHIVDIRGDIYVLKMDSGGEVEAFRDELSYVDPSLFKLGGPDA